MLQGVKNIIFDLGGVLIDLDRQRCIDAFTILGYPQIDRLIGLYGSTGVFGQLELGEVSGHDVCEHIRTESGHPELTDAQIHEAYSTFLVALPAYKLNMILRLRQAGLRTYLLSNTNAMMWGRIEQMFLDAGGHPMGEYFDTLYLSFRMHKLKPAHAIFEQMIADSGIVPSESLFIDDGEQNVLAARKLGFEVYMPRPREDFSHLFDEIIHQ